MIISFILVTLMCDSGGYFKEKLDASHLRGLRVDRVELCEQIHLLTKPFMIVLLLIFLVVVVVFFITYLGDGGGAF